MMDFLKFLAEKRKYSAHRGQLFEFIWNSLDKTIKYGLGVHKERHSKTYQGLFILLEIRGQEGVLIIRLGATE